MSSPDKKEAALERFEHMRLQPVVDTREFHDILGQLLDAADFKKVPIGKFMGQEEFEFRLEDPALEDALDEMDTLLHSLTSDVEGEINFEEFGGYHWNLAKQGKISTIPVQQAYKLDLGDVDYSSCAAWLAAEEKIMHRRINQQ